MRHIFRLAIASTIVTLWPAIGYADDQPTPTDTPTVQNSDQTPTPTATPSLTNPLGNAGGNAPAGASTGDSTSLQPAGANPLQSTTNASSGLTAPNNLLQGSAPNEDTLKVLKDDADGAPQTPPDTNSQTPWPFIGLAAAILIILEASLVAPQIKQIIGRRLRRRKKADKT